MNTLNQFSQCATIKYFMDGNEAIFQEQYCFIQLSAENKNSPNLEKFLSHFRVQVLKQSEFDLIHTQEEVCWSLINKLKVVLPCFKVWIENEDGNVDIRNNLKSIESKLDILNVFQADELKITYSGIEFTKNVNIHFNETSLYVTYPWNSNSVLLKLSDILCKYFQVVGHEKKLDFLLRSSGDEVQKYFVQEQIDFSEEVLEIRFESEGDLEQPKISSFADIETAIKDKKISAEFYHMSKHDSCRREYIESLIPRAVDNVIEHLKQLPEYDCTNIDGIARSVISGITKNGNEITVAIENYLKKGENQVQRVKYASDDALRFKETLIKSMSLRAAR